MQFLERILHRVRIRMADLARFQENGAEAALAPGADRLFALIPNYFGVIENVRREMLLEIREAHRVACRCRQLERGSR